jgi:hypothetical protein
MLFVKDVVGLLPLPLNRLGTVTSKIVESTKLSSNGSLVEAVSHRIPFNSALPIVIT